MRRALRLKSDAERERDAERRDRIGDRRPGARGPEPDERAQREICRGLQHPAECELAADDRKRRASDHRRAPASEREPRTPSALPMPGSPGARTCAGPVVRVAKIAAPA